MFPHYSVYLITSLVGYSFLQGSNTTVATWGAGTAYRPRANEFIPVFHWGSWCWIFSFLYKYFVDLCPYIVLVSVDHWIVCRSSNYGFWLVTLNTNKNSPFPVQYSFTLGLDRIFDCTALISMRDTAVFWTYLGP